MAYNDACLLQQSYQVFCERIYLDQSKMKTMKVSRYGSWKSMLVQRPRLRMNGFYYLKTSYIKKPVRDMWTDILPGQILEVR